MIGSFNINDSSDKRDIFYNVGFSKFQTWQKPPNCTFVQIFMLGGGGGGGAGNTGAAGTSRRGGAGGGSSGTVTTLFLATTLPDTLYIRVGSGGDGGTGTANGGAGVISYVTLFPDTAFTASNVVMQSGSAGAGGGLSGFNGGTAGTAGTVWSTTGSIIIDLGMSIYWVGQAGALGNTSATPAPLVLSGITTGGGAGAGTNASTAQNGGNVVGFGFIPTMSGGTAGGGDGSGEYKSYTPTNINYTTNQLVFMGGAGGGSSNNAAGGAGGNAAYGSGGGGGGAGVTASVAGAGGHGGDGIVIITSW